MSALPVMLVAVGVGVDCPRTVLGVAVGRDDPSAVAEGDCGCSTLDVGLASGVLVGREVAVAKVVGVDVGTVVGVVMRGRVGVAVGTRAGVKVGVMVGVLVGVGVFVGVGVGGAPGVAHSGPNNSSGPMSSTFSQ